MPASPPPTPGSFLPASAQIKAAEVAEVVPPPKQHADGLFDAKQLDEWTEKKVDEIELIGEEIATGYTPRKSDVTPGMRYLHSSRTIHQLVTDRNRAVGLYLAVASLLWTASAALLNVKGDVKLMVPLATLQFWCMPVTLGTCTLLALFTAFLLIRTRIGLIYEVAKMNVLLGLPIGRVQRVNVLSIFFIMHLMVCLLGAGSGFLFVYHLARYGNMSDGTALTLSGLAGLVIFAALIGVYIGTVVYTTSDDKLQSASK